MNDSCLELSTRFNPDKSFIKAMARVGLTFRMKDESCGDFTYLGRGPVETYADRKSCGLIDVFKSSPSKEFHYYVLPEATGNHTDTRWLSINGAGMKISTSLPSFQFSITPYTDTNIDFAQHVNQLVDDGKVTVHLDAEQQGVGTATCGPGVLPKYCVPVRNYDFSFYFNFGSAR
jgi:beta-galactosidase